MQQMIDETLAVYRKLDDLNQLEQKDALVEKRQKKRRRNSSDVYQS